MYNKIDAPATGAPGNGDSKIVLDITASTILQNAAASNGGVLSNEPKIETAYEETSNQEKENEQQTITKRTYLLCL